MKLGLGKLANIGLTGAGAPAIAVDFGTSSMKVLQLGPGEIPTILAASTLPTPLDLAGDVQKRLDYQIDNLARIVRTGGFLGRRIVFAAPAASTVCARLQVSSDGSTTLQANIAAALGAQVGCDARALSIRFEPTPGTTIEGKPRTGQKADVIAMALPTGLIERLMEALRKQRLEPVGIYPEAQALVRAFDHITRRASDAALASMYVDIGSESTKVVIAHGTQPVFAKSVQFGGRMLDEAVSKQTGRAMAAARALRLAADQLTPDAQAFPAAVLSEDPPAPASADRGQGERFDALEAAQARAPRRAALSAGAAGKDDPHEHDPAPSPGAYERRGRVRSGPDAPAEIEFDDAAAAGLGAVEPVRLDLREQLEVLTEEMGMCLRYHDGSFTGRRVSRAIFVGGESRHTALCQHVARAMRLPAHVADPLARLNRPPVDAPTISPLVDLSQPQPGWAVAVGLGLSPTDL
ncbi:MAG: hypothetical protein C0475_05755 [Planctomyces sp.]|nr:hypothetical protein [Planctomyces sp.]